MTKKMNAGDDGFTRLLLSERSQDCNFSENGIFITSTSNSQVTESGDIAEEIRGLTSAQTFPVRMVGSTGMMWLEPLLEIQIPGKARLVYRNVVKESVKGILEGAIHGFPSHPLLFAQRKRCGGESWAGVPVLEEMENAGQADRLVLSESGIIDPCSIHDAVLSGTWKAFVKCLRYYTSEEVCTIVDKSCLRGRSGGGFPAADKWRMVLQNTSEKKYLICNADESDPGAFMVRTLIEGDPHKVLEGICIASYASGISTAYIYIRNDYSLAVHRMRKAIEDAYETGLLGHNILDSGYNLDVQVFASPGSFVCGEETALISSMEGKRGAPRPKPPYPVQSGLNGKPTVINNAETLANVPAIIVHGPSWFLSRGTKKSPGTKLVSISGSVERAGVYETDMGTSLGTLVNTMAGAGKDGESVRAVLCGGPAGYLIPDSYADLNYDYESMQSGGYSLGSGSILVLGSNACLVDFIRYTLVFMEGESCGKCIPCREGTRQLRAILDMVSKRPDNKTGFESLERFRAMIQAETIAGVMKETSLCGLGMNATNPLLSLLKNFREEIEEHLYERKCRAGVCKGLRMFRVLPDACTGCTVCEKKCPEKAIIGSPRHPYFILEEKCTGCGKCYEVCKFSAITIL
jgi:NADH:ubiquinone oxidoreductase subunit F (NADH-binding)/Pyruvate/2-oxoacid:ferredoxin oxidoreductase delta subunit